MPTTGSRQLRRQRKQVDRRRFAREVGARKTKRHQAIAAAHRDPANVRLRHATAFALWSLAALLAVIDFLEYTDTIRWMSTELAIVVLGLPAAMLAVGGAMVYGT